MSTQSRDQVRERLLSINGLFNGKTYFENLVNYVLDVQHQAAQEAVISELTHLKQGHNPPYKSGNAGILLNAIDERLAALKKEEA